MLVAGGGGDDGENGLSNKLTNKFGHQHPTIWASYPALSDSHRIRFFFHLMNWKDFESGLI